MSIEEKVEKLVALIRFIYETERYNRPDFIDEHIKAVLKELEEEYSNTL